MIEVLIASSILAAVVVGLTMPFAVAAEHQQLDATRTTAATLLTQMMERMMVKPYDDVVAMDGYSESGRNITDLAGQPLNDATLTGYTITVATREQRIAVGDQTNDEASVFCIATVSVSHSDMNIITASRLFAR